MAREFKRSDRLGEQIQRELAELLQFHSRVRLPGLVTVSGVKVSRDMGYADVYISVLGGGDDAPETAMAAIQSQKGICAPSSVSDCMFDAYRSCASTPTTLRKRPSAWRL